MNWSWSDIEDAAMDYLPHRAQVMYLRVLRRRMDFDTCIVGLTVRLSYQLIGEWLEERPAVRSNKSIVRLSVGEIRAIFSMLERVGLIERVQNNKNEVMPLVFKLPLALTGLIRQKYEQQQNSGRATANCSSKNESLNSEFNSIKSNDSEDILVVDKCNYPQQKIAMNDSKNSYEQHTSGSIKIFNNNIYTFRTRSIASLISDDWLPSVEMVERLLSEFGLPPKFIFTKAVELRLLWIEQGKAVSDWDGYFYGTCRNQIENGREDFIRAINQKSEGSV